MNFDTATGEEIRQYMTRLEAETIASRIEHEAAKAAEPPCIAHKNDGVFYQCRCSKCIGVSQGLLQRAAAYVTEIINLHGDCEHDVGHCVCADKRLRRELEAAALAVITAPKHQ